MRAAVKASPRANAAGAQHASTNYYKTMTSHKPLLEVCAFNLASCLIAEKAGAARVELCDSPSDGGTTPSYGVIKKALEKTSLLVYPIIRPRAGNFFYSDEEFEVMLEDIAACRALGCHGIATGAARADGALDTERMKRLVDAAGPMGVTCHRVFDASPDPLRALEDAVACGCERILSSGGRASAPQGRELLRELVRLAGSRIIIMPGAGIKSSNVRDLLEHTGAREFHASARRPAGTELRCEAGDFGDAVIADEAELRAILNVLHGPKNFWRACIS